MPHTDGETVDLRKRVIEREHKQGSQQREREKEAGSPVSKEPNVGLNPRIPGSQDHALNRRQIANS